MRFCPSYVACIAVSMNNSVNVKRAVPVQVTEQIPKTNFQIGSLVNLILGIVAFYVIYLVPTIFVNKNIKIHI